MSNRKTTDVWSNIVIKKDGEPYGLFLTAEQKEMLVKTLNEKAEALTKNQLIIGGHFNEINTINQILFLLS